MNLASLSRSLQHDLDFNSPRGLVSRQFAELSRGVRCLTQSQVSNRIAGTALGDGTFGVISSHVDEGIKHAQARN